MNDSNGDRPPLPFSKPTPDTVVLLHGLGRTRWSMTPLAGALTHEGYRVINVSYPSRSVPLESLARDWLPRLLRENGVATSATAPRVHFITHSMGGIVVRLWLRECGVPANLGRVVMLAPPNAGSELPDRLDSFAPYRWFTGVNGGRLGAGADSLPQVLGPWPAPAADLGIIAGTRSLNPWTSSLLSGPGDGKVTVASTHLVGERDHVVLPHSHTWLMWHDDTIKQVKAFLRDGRFRSGK